MKLAIVGSFALQRSPLYPTSPHKLHNTKSFACLFFIFFTTATLSPAAPHLFTLMTPPPPHPTPQPSLSHSPQAVSNYSPLINTHPPSTPTRQPAEWGEVGEDCVQVVNASTILHKENHRPLVQGTVVCPVLVVVDYRSKRRRKLSSILSPRPPEPLPEARRAALFADFPDLERLMAAAS